MSTSDVNAKLAHSSILKFNSSDEVSTMGLVGKALTVANQMVRITDSDKNKKSFSLQIVIPNPRTNIAKALVSVYVSAGPQVNELLDLYTEAEIDPGATFVFGDMRLSNNECIFVTCDQSGLAVRVEGYADGRH